MSIPFVGVPTPEPMEIEQQRGVPLGHYLKRMLIKPTPENIRKAWCSNQLTPECDIWLFKFSGGSSSDLVKPVAGALSREVFKR
jgi:hypothetical protein